MKKYKFIGNGRGYEWEEKPVHGKIYGGSYSFGMNDTLAENFKRFSDDYFKGECTRAEYYSFITDWEVVDVDEFVVDNQLADRVSKLEEKVFAMDIELYDLHIKLLNKK
jgi:hypothetical protein